MASMAISAPFGLAAASLTSVSPLPSAGRNLLRFAPSASLDHRGLHGRIRGPSLKPNEQTQHCSILRYDAAIEAKTGNPPIMPAVMTPGGPLDLSSVLFRNRIIFIGQPVNSQVAQRVISQLLTLASIDDDADILVYLNCPGGSTYSVLAIYDCMSWIKPKVGTVCFGVAASQGALLLAGGEKGMRYAMPNARIMIHQPQSGCGGHVEDVRRQVQEAVQSRHKIDKMYTAFTGQPLEKVQQYTERDRFFSSSEALEFGLIDGVLETEY
ncbi:ATP-dependent Clp protease proteolytic subunit 6, chloroplastic [Cocos nucifera]|uniref:ATP-dependent Clp protease proteolytic subunit n=1 Tax=Cocos nucifera TaxID=13894 RepID=A0A8K0I872_COCNU|nr:ATP-dependent Clp protease proteolytic subunit 6, chloroplastic [Cocos nucifera]